MISLPKWMQTGAFYSLMASFSFSCMNVFTKAAAARIPSEEIVFFRSFIAGILIALYMWRTKRSFKGRNLPLLIFRGILGAVALLGVFYTIANIRLADATIIFQTNPIFVILFAAYFLKEKTPKNYFIVLLASLIGCLLIIKPGFEGVNSLAASIGVLSAILAAGAYICVRSLSQKNDSYTIIFYFVLVASFVSFPLMLKNYVQPSLIECFLLFMVAALSCMGQLFLTNAYRAEKSGLVSLLSYSGILFGILWGYFLWSELMDIYSIIGGILIAGSCLSLTLSKQKA